MHRLRMQSLPLSGASEVVCIVLTPARPREEIFKTTTHKYVINIRGVF